MEKLKINYSDCAKMADSLSVGFTSLWVNLKPGKPCVEIIALSESDEYDFSDPDVDLDEMLDWEREIYESEWKLRDMLDSWTESVEIENAPSYESFRWMEEFVDEVIGPRDSNVAGLVACSIGGSGTFSRFKVAVARAGFLDEWYEFLNGRRTDYVAAQFRNAGIEVVDNGGLPVVKINDL